MFFNFDAVGAVEPDDNEDEEVSKDKLDISEVLKHITEGDTEWFGTLQPEVQKLFTPYTVQRWVSNIDDSVQVSYPSKVLEGVFGQWKTGGKESINEFIASFNAMDSKHNCSAVQKYEHQKFDWRIKFSMCSKSSADAIMAVLEEFGIRSGKIIQGDSSQYAKDHLFFMNAAVNTHLFELNDHPELLYRLMCSVHKMLGKPQTKHAWTPFGTKGVKSNSKILEVLKYENSLPDMNDDEYFIIMRGLEKKDFEDILKGQAIDSTEIKSLLKIFKTEKDKIQ